MQPGTTPIGRQAYVTGFSCTNTEGEAAFGAPWIGHEHTGRPMPLDGTDSSPLQLLDGQGIEAIIVD